MNRGKRIVFLKQRIDACKLAAHEIRAGMQEGFGKTEAIRWEMKRKEKYYLGQANKFQQQLESLMKRAGPKKMQKRVKRRKLL